MAALIASLPSCSTIGDPGGSPDAYPHGGTGQFRRLTADEVGAAGRAIDLSNVAIDGSMVADGYLFYAAAPLRDTPPEVPAEHPAREVFWDAFEPRAIHRAEPQDNRGFSAGPQILAASESWEGGEVFDPWIVIDGGRARLYYAAEGGVGLAEASSVDGTFTRVGSGPILEAAGDAAPRRPSVVLGADGAWWMYFDDGGAIGVARSEDGVDFERVDGDPSTDAIDPLVIGGEDLGEEPEVSVGMPGAAALDTATGRRLVRLYYESRREDGSVLAYVAGSTDGVTFERHEVPVMEQPDVRFPVPVLLDDRITLLYVNLPSSGTYQTRLLGAAVSPATVSFAPLENDEE